MVATTPPSPPPPPPGVVWLQGASAQGWVLFLLCEEHVVFVGWGGGQAPFDLIDLWGSQTDLD